MIGPCNNEISLDEYPATILKAMGKTTLNICDLYQVKIQDDKNQIELKFVNIITRCPKELNAMEKIIQHNNDNWIETLGVSTLANNTRMDFAMSAT